MLNDFLLCVDALFVLLALVVLFASISIVLLLLAGALSGRVFLKKGEDL